MALCCRKGIAALPVSQRNPTLVTHLVFVSAGERGRVVRPVAFCPAVGTR